MTDLNEDDRGRLIRAAYRNQPPYIQQEIDHIAGRLEDGVKERARPRNMMFGPVSAMELTWALARMVWQRN